MTIETPDLECKLGLTISGIKDNYKIGGLLWTASDRTRICSARGESSGQAMVVKQFTESESHQYFKEKLVQKLLAGYGGHENLLLGDEFLDEMRVIVSQYAKGGDVFRLRERLGKFQPIQTRKIMRGLCNGLEYMHENGIIYCDVKPTNLVLALEAPLERITAESLVSQSELITPQLLDFEMGCSSTIYQLKATKTGGTPQYMAPEVLRGAQPDPQSDVYGAGLVLYELLAGRCLLQGDSKAEMLWKYLFFSMPDVSELNPSVPPAFKEVLEKSLADKPDKRYQTAREFGLAIEEALIL
ncbi:MAG TPA: serine/threonine-protein kinase [Candidatus Nanoarchaeia archaeon]|nr:serine/threonine-protein kinase [Candidatus Nanoarchaeia archaeon]